MAQIASGWDELAVTNIKQTRYTMQYTIGSGVVRQLVAKFELRKVVSYLLTSKRN